MAKEEKSPTTTEEVAVDGAITDAQALKCELKKKVAETNDSVAVAEKEEAKSGAKEEEAKNGTKEEEAKNGTKEEEAKNGTNEVKAKDGNKEEEAKNGTKEEEAKNGTNEVEVKDTKKDAAEDDTKNGTKEEETKTGPKEEDKSAEKVNGNTDETDTKTEEKYHESPTKNEAYILLAQGKRNYLVKDYSSAVATLGDCCAKFSEIFGELADECGDVYFSYGKALLELAREESGVLGSAIEKDKEEESDNDEDDDEVEEEEDAEEKETTEEKESAEVKENGTVSKEKDGTGADVKESKENGESSENEKMEVDGKTDGEKETKEEDAAEEDVNNLQLAWEMLELAKIIYERQKSEEKLADTLSKLGEVSLETENYEQAIEDMSKSLEIQQKILSADNRGVAETYFQLGVACSLANFHDRSISYFKKAKEVLELRIKNLKTKTEPDAENSKDAFYTLEGEIKEIEAILPEIDDKIADMEDFKAETLKALTASIIPAKLKEGESSSSSSSAAADSSASASKPVSDISHLIRKKRKPDEVAEGSECKIKRAATESAEDSKEKAEDSKGKAEDSKEKAEDSKGKAEDSKGKAEDSKEKAEDSKEKAEDSKEKADEVSADAEMKEVDAKAV